MTPEKILDIASCYNSFYDPDDKFTFVQEDLIAFAQSLIEAERERIKSRTKVATVIILCFLFSGDPDVWDVLHDYVMRVLQ